MSLLPNDLRTLTTCRFLAAFWVFLFHLRSRIDYDQNWLWDIVENGARGVDFFFILSGFVIFHVYEGQIATGKFSLWDFIKKRIARIYPLHMAMIIVFVFLALLGENPIQGMLPSVFLMHAWGTTDGLVLNGPSWTLSAEMFAYLLFGITVIRPPQTWLLMLTFALTFVVVHILAVALGKTAFIHLTWDFGALRILPLFILGMLLRRVAPRISSRFAASLGALGVILVLWIGNREGAGYEILAPFALIILAGARLSDRRRLPTNFAFPVYLGEISYSIYMIHIFAISVFFDYLPKLGLQPPHWTLVCAAVVAGSSISYHLIEVPSRRFINRLGRNA